MSVNWKTLVQRDKPFLIKEDVGFIQWTSNECIFDFTIIIRIWPTSTAETVTLFGILDTSAPAYFWSFSQQRCKGKIIGELTARNNTASGAIVSNP